MRGLLAADDPKEGIKALIEIGFKNLETSKAKQLA
jgi:hypothetical protein